MGGSERTGDEEDFDYSLVDAQFVLRSIYLYVTDECA